MPKDEPTYNFQTKLGYFLKDQDIFGFDTSEMEKLMFDSGSVSGRHARTFIQAKHKLDMLLYCNSDDA